MQTEFEIRDWDSPRVYPNPDVLGVSAEIKPKILPLEYWPATTLSKQCETVVDFDITLQQLIYDMACTMYHHNGVGLAAPQVGQPLNVIIVELKNAISMINPRIVESDDNYMYAADEGCLSVPGYFEKRKRPQRVVVEYQKSSGIETRTEFQGMAAFVVQHEIDHLNGNVFVDDLSKFKKDRIKKKIKKFKNRK